MHLDPINYFAENCVDESLVMSFVPDVPTSIVIVIYPALRLHLPEHLLPPTDVRPARKIEFLRISNFALTNWKGVEYASVSYNSQKDQGSKVIYDIEVKRIRGNYGFQGEISSFGTIRFEFAELRCQDRNLLVKTPVRDGEWLYFDSDSGKEVNFHDPFQEWNGSGSR